MINSALKTVMLSAWLFIPFAAHSDNSPLERHTETWLSEMQRLPLTSQGTTPWTELLNQNFIQLPVEIRVPLQGLSPNFSRPGEAFIYALCISDGAQKKESANSPETIREAETAFTDLPKETRDFYLAVMERAQNMTLSEQVNTCQCSNQHTWEVVLTESHRVAYDKLVTGASLTAEDQGTLNTEASSFTPLSSNYDPWECFYSALGLYDEFLAVRGK